MVSNFYLYFKERFKQLINFPTIAKVFHSAKEMCPENKKIALHILPFAYSVHLISATDPSHITLQISINQAKKTITLQDKVRAVNLLELLLKLVWLKPTSTST